MSASTHVRPPSLVRAAAAAVVLLVLAVLGVVAAPMTASAAPGCAPVDIYYNTPNGYLYRYTPYGGVTKVPLESTFLDITFTADGTTLYGVDSGGLVEIDPQTGKNVRRVPLDNGAFLNGLAQLPDGHLLGSGGNEVIDIDPATGATQPRATLPAGEYSSGDLLVVPDGDVLVLTYGNGHPDNSLIRLHPDGTSVRLGSVPSAYGISASGDLIYVTATDGGIYSLDDVPTVEGDGPLEVTKRFESGVTAYGATSINESKPCNTAFEASVSDESTPYGSPPDLLAYGYPAGTGGTVTFTWDGRTLCTADVVGEVSRCTAPTLPPGNYPVTATLSEGGTATTNFTVERYSSSLVASADPDRIPVGTSTRLTVTGLPAAATGTVSFQGDDYTYCSVTLPDTSCTTDPDLGQSPYDYPVFASYSGDDTYAPASAQTSFQVYGPDPTGDPTSGPTTNPGGDSTSGPTTDPTGNPTSEPTTSPTSEPTSSPTTEPSTEPTSSPTTEPTSSPTTEPTSSPTTEPTSSPTTEPTSEPTFEPDHRAHLEPDDRAHLEPDDRAHLRAHLQPDHRAHLEPDHRAHLRAHLQPDDRGQQRPDRRADHRADV